MCTRAEAVVCNWAMVTAVLSHQSDCQTLHHRGMQKEHTVTIHLYDLCLKALRQKLKQGKIHSLLY